MVSAHRQHRPHRGSRSFAAPTTGLKRRLVLATLGSALLVECAAALVTSPLFRVRTITVNGISTLLPDERTEVLAAVSPLQNSNYFQYSGTDCLKRLAAIPCVDSESMGRTLRVGLEVTVTPRRVAALLDGANGFWEIASSGLVIRKATTSAGNVPSVLAGCGVLQPGDRPSGSRLESALYVLNRVESTSGLQCSKITVDPDGNVWLNVLGTVAVNLGQPQHLKKKLAVLVHIVQIDPNIGSKVSLVDLTYPEQPACIPRQSSLSASSQAGKSMATHHASAHKQGLQ